MRTMLLRPVLALLLIAPVLGAQRVPRTPPAPPIPAAPAMPPSPAMPAAPAWTPLPPMPPDAPLAPSLWDVDVHYTPGFDLDFHFDEMMPPHLDHSFDFEPLTGMLSTQPTMLRSGERFPQDPQDSVYREARTLFNRGEWRRAATMFAQVASRTPVSSYAPDALYYQAFALYRIGGVSELREGLAALDDRKARFPRARNPEEAEELALRIGGALAARGDRSAVNRVRENATAAAAACDTEEAQVRASALSVLMRNDPDAAMPLLVRVLDRKDDCSVSLRKSAVMLIGTKGDATSKTKLADVARSDPSTEVRADAIGYLAKVSGDEVVGALEAVIRNESEEENVQRAAVRALGAHESGRARSAIRALVERSSAPERLRLEAISTFDRNATSGFNYAYACSGNDCTAVAPGQGYSGGSVVTPRPAQAPVATTRPTVVSVPSARSGQAAMIADASTIEAIRFANSESERRIAPDDAAWLRGVYPRLETPRLKSRAVAVLSRASDEPTLIWLMDLIQREEEPTDVRATVLSRLGRELPISQLNRLYDGASSRTVRSQIIEVLGGRKEPESTDKLIEIVRSGTDPQLRRSAIAALNNKKDPRTTQLLLELIDR
jgi:HEAT repeat protein